LKTELMKQSLPLQLKAYERLTIMLERITPSNLVLRVNKGNMNGGQLQLELLKAIREEFEHNTSMQIYVSDMAWEMTKVAKEETLQLIKIAASKVGAEGSSMQLSKEVFDLENKTGNSAIQQAARVVRNEARGKMIQT
jgi:ankyrin repeat protein